MKLRAITEPEDLINTVSKIVYSHLNKSDFHCFLFGSRATNTAQPASDFDFGIEGNTSVDRTTLSQIQEELENLHTLFHIDLVDFNRVEDRFKKVAAQNRRNL